MILTPDYRSKDKDDEEEGSPPRGGANYPPLSF
jgi:hypothetical protein